MILNLLIKIKEIFIIPQIQKKKTTCSSNKKQETKIIKPQRLDLKGKNLNKKFNENNQIETEREKHSSLFEKINSDDNLKEPKVNEKIKTEKIRQLKESNSSNINDYKKEIKEEIEQAKEMNKKKN